MTRFPFALLFCLSVWSGVAADDTPTGPWQLDARFSVLRFGYKELDDDGAVLDREYGRVPGVVVEGSYRRQRWAFSGGVSVHNGDVTYDGQTQSGIPLTSRTDMLFIDRYGRVEWWGWRRDEKRMALYGGAGFRTWDREIRASQTESGIPVSGLNEYYRWGHVFAGSRFVVASGGSYWGMDIRLTRTLWPSLEIPAQLGYDGNTLRLGERFGGRFSGSWRREIGPRMSVCVEPYYERWDFGRSDTEPLTRGGVVVGTVHEPRSETRNFGVDLGLARRF